MKGGETNYLGAEEKKFALPSWIAHATPAFVETPARQARNDAKKEKSV